MDGRLMREGEGGPVWAASVLITPPTVIRILDRRQLVDITGWWLMLAEADPTPQDFSLAVILQYSAPTDRQLGGDEAVRCFQ